MNGTEIKVHHPALVAEIARILHNANTGKIVPDPSDPTLYRKMSIAVLNAGFARCAHDVGTEE